MEVVMNKQQIAAAREIVARVPFVDEYHLAMMICGAIGVAYETVILWVRATAAI
jgi:hypothetical protein